jgi:hypothetical protein
LDGVPGRAPLSRTLRGKRKTPSVPRTAKTKRSNRNQVLDCRLAAVDAVPGRRERERESEKRIWPNKTATNRTEQKISAEKRLAIETKI